MKDVFIIRQILIRIKNIPALFIITEEFPRLRIGIGRPPERADPADYVLSRFSADERTTIDRAIISAADSIECWVSEGIDACMNRFNAEGAED